ncbi:MAG: hypothetical protein HYR56_10980 [Acidobacteria bacterium]|nr:hypothetical protein [Acidobacteriota bacterium]
MQRRFFSTPAAIPVTAPTLAEALHAAAPSEAFLPRHDPPLEPRDDAVFLLTAAAEIEHALMVQYLFTAYSLWVDNPSLTAEQRAKLSDLQGTVIGIAQEEMAHLLTVQNLLHLLGGPLNFNREQAPYASEIYPFRFKLEALTLDSLAKYVLAESPLEWPADISADERADIKRRALRSNEDTPVRHVGPIFASLQALFKDHLTDADFRLDTLGLQGGDDWGSDPLIVRTFGGADVAQARQAALAAIADIARQGEGHENQPKSHFERFLDSFRVFKELSGGGRQLTWPVAENPNTTTAREVRGSGAPVLEALAEAHERKGRITDARAKNWAHLFNLRYRLLLAHLSHYLRLDQSQAPALGTQREKLRDWTFNEMVSRLGPIARQLVQMPKDDPPGKYHAGPPFELPYTLNLPQRETDRWRMQLDVAKAAQALAQRMVNDGETGAVLSGLLDADAQQELADLQALAAGHDPFAGGGGGTGGGNPAPAPLSFAADIKDLFRARDHTAMLARGLDLHDHQQVSAQAAEILARVTDGSMPCDSAGRWPPERVAKFQQWITDGKQS